MIQERGVVMHMQSPNKSVDHQMMNIGNVSVINPD